MALFLYREVKEFDCNCNSIKNYYNKQTNYVNSALSAVKYMKLGIIVAKGFFIEIISKVGKYLQGNALELGFHK